MIVLMKRILDVAGPYKRRILAAFVFSFLKAMLSKSPLFLSFLALGWFCTGSVTAQRCLLLGVGMALCLALQIVFQHAADRLQSAAGFLVFSDLRMKLGAHLRKLPMGYFTEGNIGRISSVLSSDMVFIEENCMTVLGDMMSDLFSQAVMTAFLFFVDPRLGLAALAVLAVICLAARRMQAVALTDSALRQEQNNRLTDAVLDFTEGIGVIKTYDLLGERSRELTGSFEKMCETSIAFEENHTPWSRRLNLLYGLGAAVILAAAALLYSGGALPAAGLLGILLFALEVFAPVRALYANATRLTVMNSCMDRIEEVFAEKELPDEGVQTIPDVFRGPELAFEHVRFGYGEKEVLHDVSFALPKNQMLALVGPSGSGKSTIASLFARFWDVDGGRVLVRGRDVRDIPLAELMAHISMVFQRVYLFKDTIYHNISMGRPDASREEVIAAAKKARCYDFIMALPKGFDTVVGEGGGTLSGGEKQRISIARAILKDAPIVILDEATASVDADNERYIQQAISELCQGKTLLVIAHRLSTIRSADNILVVAGGQVQQTGSHDALMAEDGIYRSFVSLRETSHF